MKEKMAAIFKSDTNYYEAVKQYNAIDGILAIILYLLCYVSYYFMGYLYLTKKLYFGEAVNLLLAVITILFVKIRKQKLASVGITKYQLKKAVVLGCIIGFLYLFFGAMLPGVIQGREWNPPPTILYNLFFYLVIIGFVEELIFRGFIQTRLHGLIHNENAVTAAAGILFSLMHVPFQMALNNMNTFQYISANIMTLIILIFWHIVFAFLYKKYNSIVTGTLFHGFMDMCSGLFR
jgi:CAAX amino terminal protease family.